MNNTLEIIELIKSGDAMRLVKMMDENPALANQKTEQGISLLQFAVYFRNPQVIDVFRKHTRALDLFEASSLGDLETVSALLDKHPEKINSFSPDGFTPLGLACFFGHIDVVKCLTKKGANPNLASNNSFRVAPIHSASAISHLEIATVLIAHGANVNVRQAQGFTPLHSAAHNGQTALVKLLVDSKANINVKTDAGQTPLEMAIEKNFKETAFLIKKRGGV